MTVPLLYPPYLSTRLRAPRAPLWPLPDTLSEQTGPTFGPDDVRPGAEDLTRPGTGEALGQRIQVSGRIFDGEGRPVPGTLVELWQANAAGRYQHPADVWNAPLDPGFSGGGRVLTDAEGRYRFLTIRPGAYPWHNHPNAWRPAHLHFSVFGASFRERLVTQMYFAGDPLLAVDPICASAGAQDARARLCAAFDWDTTEDHHALGHRFDIHLGTTPSQTVGPFFAIGLAAGYRADLAPPAALGERVTLTGRVLDGEGRPVPDACLELWQANAAGRYAHPADAQQRPLDPAFRGFGRVPTGPDGELRVTTIRPGPVPGPGGRPQAPHILVSVFARGLLRRLATRVYFPDPALAADPVLAALPADRRATLVARALGGGAFEWNVVLQGANETLFFEV